MIAGKRIELAVQLFAICLAIGLTSCLSDEPPSVPTGPVVIGNGDPDAGSGDPPGQDPPGGNPPAEDPPGGDPPAEDPPGGDPPAEDPPGGDPPPPPPPPGPSAGIWISQAEIQALPGSGPAWNAVRARADAPAGSPDLSNQDQDHNIAMLAKALVYARTGETRYRDEVVAGCMAAIDSERGGRTLALGRELLAYVIAADLVGLDAAAAVECRAWWRRTLTEELRGRTLRSTHEDRPNNWGTHAGASRAAVAAYLGDTAELERTAQVFRGWLGDRSAYAGFDYGDLSWQADGDRPVGINPPGALRGEVPIDGALPDDMRRGCAFRDPPCHTGYAWEALQGATVQAEILYRQGYDAWNWSDRALLRAAQYLYDLDRRHGGWWAEGDDEWNVWLLNHAYGTDFPAELPAAPGKNMGWTDWTHAR